jgi:hypothetical protein
METNVRGKQTSFPGRVGTILCMWFLAGMPLSMLLSGIYTLLGVSLPPLFFFLSSLIYLTGGLLGGMWSQGNLRRKGLSWINGIAALFVLLLSIGFLLLGIIFVVRGFQRL